MNIIEMRGITKTFGNTHALKQVDFELRKGEVLSLLGENGAGRSTLSSAVSAWSISTLCWCLILR